MLLNKLEETILLAQNDLTQAKSLADIEELRIKYLGKKGLVTSLMQELRNLPADEKRQAGALINAEKVKLQDALSAEKERFELEAINQSLQDEAVDVSMPGKFLPSGSTHPINIVIDRIVNYFAKLGFKVVEGGEIETEHYNFDALNIAKSHPARDEQDTFWLQQEGLLLRTQTSGMQIRSMEQDNAPIRVVSPGKVYRNDYDQTHTPMFHQVEILCVDENINFANLKSILNDFLEYFFKRTVTTRFRPSFFPFTEPSAEVDIMDENGKWLEVLGCGMVHQKVLENVNIDGKKYTGFAIGIGVERFAMLYYKIPDIRVFFENDVRFLQQFIAE